MQSTTFHNCSGQGGGGSSSSTVMAAVVITIAHKRRFSVKEKRIFTIRAVFVNHLPRTGILKGNNDSTGCVRGESEEYATTLSFFLYLCFFTFAIQACFHFVGVI